MAKCVECGSTSHKESSNLCETCLNQLLQINIECEEQKYF